MLQSKYKSIIEGNVSILKHLMKLDLLLQKCIQHWHDDILSRVLYMHWQCWEHNASLVRQYTSFFIHLLILSTMMQTHDEALEYLHRNLTKLDENYADFPQETLDVLLMERLYEKLAPVMTQEHVDHLQQHQQDENYADYSRTYMAQFVAWFYDLLADTIQEMLHEVHEELFEL